MRSDQILLVEDDASLRNLLQDELEAENYDVSAVTTAEAAIEHLEQANPDLLISDLRLPGESGLTLLPRIRELEHRPAVMLITAFGTVQQAVEALKSGADDFMTKPLDMDHFLITVSRLLASRRLQHEVDQYRSHMAAPSFHGIVAESQPMMNLRHQISRMAGAQGPVLIIGESGTGKELVARAIHEESERHGGPYLTVNCGSIPGELMESEFFGHTTGAFTGARNARQGLFQQSDGGTLLLDEIGEMPLALQAKLLRVLQDGQLRPVGSDRELRVDIRILAATNRDLPRAVRDGEFREDLFYRLETFTLEVPPLRQRGDDLVLLANHFLARHAARRNIFIRGFSDATLEALRAYPFPGNVRELENAIERAVTFCDGDTIEPAHLPRRIRDTETQENIPFGAEEQTDSPFAAPDKQWQSLEQVQKRHIDFILRQTGGNKRRAASILGITRRTLYRWLEQP